MTCFPKNTLWRVRSFLLVGCLLLQVPRWGAVRIAVDDPGVVAWQSDSITTNTPYLHYEFQLETSLDLLGWTNFGSLIPGGVLSNRSVTHRVPLARTNRFAFYRLNYRLNAPGVDLSGADLSGTDLRNANLSGANLSNAILTEAQLSGANLAGALLNGVNFDGIELAGVNLDGALGVSPLAQLIAPADADAAEYLPYMRYQYNPVDFSVNDPEFPGPGVSIRNAMVMLRTNVTVGQLNALLQRENASIVSCAPRDALLPNALLTVRFPTTNAMDLYRLTQRLITEPIIAAAAPEVFTVPKVVTRNTSASAAGFFWRWNPTSVSAGGNWGLEYSRVPQMWNFNDSVEKNGSTNFLIGIYESGFPAHIDLPPFVAQLGSTNILYPDHGLHVAGIIGANYGNNVGIDGIYRYPRLAGYSFAAGSSAPDAQDMRNLIAGAPGIRIINISQGFAWAQRFDPITGDPFLVQLTPAQIVIASNTAVNLAAPFDTMARSVPNILFVAAAGNDSNIVTANIASMENAAALILGTPNIIVVESHGFGVASGFSNKGGHIQAPGESILSTVTGNAYDLYNGTSMAAPFVTGVAATLLSIDTSLLATDLIQLLTLGGTRVDAFASAMEIENLGARAGSKMMLKRLLDIDDGSLDGNERVLVLSGALAMDRSFEEVTGPDFFGEDLDGNRGMGDDQFDMSDFRRWRDWLLVGEGGHALNGSAGHPKKDANGDGNVVQTEEHTLFSRGDFNGDGLHDRDSEKAVPGFSGKALRTDLDVFILSGLYNDPIYQSRLDLLSLVDSVDVTVWADNFFQKNPDVTEGFVGIYDADTKVRDTRADWVLFRSASNEVVFTVPAGGKYYVASDLIDLGGGTNVIMRSIEDFDVPTNKLGADYAVDLVRFEMTAVAEVQNPNIRTNVSDPRLEIVDAKIPSDSDSPAVQSWSNDEATLYVRTRSQDVGLPVPNPVSPVAYDGTVRWHRSFIKEPNGKPMTFEVKPMELRLFGSGPQGQGLSAYATITVEMRAFDVSPDWTNLFSYRAFIAGAGGVSGHTFQVVTQEGTLDPIELKITGNSQAEYVQVKYTNAVPLNLVSNGHSFEIRYRLGAQVLSWEGGENSAEAYVGDPLEYGSGVRMQYGAFGELPYIDSFSIGNSGARHVGFYSHTNLYYILYRGRTNDQGGIPVILKLGQEGLDELIEASPPNNTTVADYSLENQLVDQPLDLDADGIDDVYELRRPAILHPLDASDALEDPDGDGRPNLREYLDGTDPAVADAAPGAPVGLYPAHLIDTDLGASAIGDVNNDGRTDLVALYDDPVTFVTSLDASLAQPDGSFLHVRSVPIPDGGEGSPVLGKLNSDAFVDAVMVNSFNNNLQVMLGDGRGFFTAGAQYQLGSSQPGRNAESVTLGDLNNDAILDAVTVNRRGRVLSILLGNGDGTFDPPSPLSLSLDPTDVAIAKLDGDAFPELIVTLGGNQLLVFPGTGGGTFGPAKTNTTASFPQRVIAGDINREGNLDVIVSHQTSDSVSVFLGNGDTTLQAKVDYPTGDNPRGMALADLDADNDPDLIVAHLGSAHHAILLNDGNGVFTAQTPAHTTANGTVLLADFTGDGRLDLLSNAEGGKVFISAGLPGARFDTRTQFPLRPMSISAYDLGDLNGDNFIDFVIGNGNTRTNEIEIVLNQGGTNLAGIGTYLIHRQVETLKLANLDDGSTLDIAVISGHEDFFQGSTNELQVFLGNGIGGFSGLAPIALNERPLDLFPGDINGDGRVDLLLIFSGTETNQFHTRVGAFLNQGSGLFAPGVTLDLGGFASRFALQDLNADGRADLIAAVSDGNKSTARIHLADASGAFTQAQEIVPPNFGSVGSFTLHDFSGDGRADLVAAVQASSQPTRLVYYAADASGTFGAETFLLEGSFAEIQIADLNGDGRADIHNGGTIRLARSTGGFESPQEYWLRSFLPMRIADLNRDGKPDLLVPDDQSDSIQVLFHR